MILIEFTERQKKILEIVQENEPITSEQIAQLIQVTRATLRSDLTILTMTGILDARPKVGYFYSGKAGTNPLSKELKKIKVKDIMSVPIAVTEETSVYDTIVILFLENVGTVFVVSNGYLSGVVSRKDLLKNAIGGSDINKVPVGMVMTRKPNIITAELEENVFSAANKIVNFEVDSLPVIEKVIMDGKEYNKVAGRISKTTLTKLLVELSKD